jgi:hypothetical protein
VKYVLDWIKVPGPSVVQLQLCVKINSTTFGVLMYAVAVGRICATVRSLLLQHILTLVRNELGIHLTTSLSIY